MANTKRLILQGKLAEFVRRYDALLRLIKQLDNNQFISARQIAVWLGPQTNQKLNIARKQEKERFYRKPVLVREYEIHLQRADALHRATQKFVSRGKLLKNYQQKLRAHRDEATRLYQVALDYLKSAYETNQDISSKWFDRPIDFKCGYRPEYNEVPRVRTTEGFRKAVGLAREKSSRGNYLHLKRELLQQEIDVMKPIYQGFERALIDISSMVKPNVTNGRFATNRAMMLGDEDRLHSTKVVNNKFNSEIIRRH